MRLGRAQPQKHLVKGYPPAVVPPTPDPTAPVGGISGAMGGRRHGRATPTRPLVQVSPRPLASTNVTITATAASATFSAPSATAGITYSSSVAASSYSAPAPGVRITFTAAPGSGTWSAPAPSPRVSVSTSAGSATWSAPDATLTGTSGPDVTIPVSAATATFSAATPALSFGTIAHGGNRTEFRGRTLADLEIDAHVARLLDEERKRADDEALVLLACA